MDYDKTQELREELRDEALAERRVWERFCAHPDPRDPEHEDEDEGEDE